MHRNATRGLVLAILAFVLQGKDRTGTSQKQTDEYRYSSHVIILYYSYMRSPPKTIFMVLCALCVAYMIDRSLLVGKDFCFVNTPITIMNVFLRMISGS